MKALILNSGLGRRMGVLTSEHPKCMTEISAKDTILSRQLKLIADAGISEVVMTTGYFDEILVNYCHSLGLPLHYTFVNNPGTERDFDSMRPGYWYGNMQFPYIRQKDGELFVRYVISDWNPTKFTHAYYPVWAADEHTERNGFRFARVGEGYLALWCSAPTVLYEADAVAEGDIRAYGEDVCWYVRVGSLAEDGSFSEFIDSVLGSGINSDKVISNIEN